MEKKNIHHFYKDFRTGMYHHLLDHTKRVMVNPHSVIGCIIRKHKAFNQISNVDEYGGWAGTHLNSNYVKFSSDGTIIHLFLIS